MARNIEIKARVDCMESLRERVAVIADGPPSLIVQDDAFFACERGRLKLRSFVDGTGELIFYQRAEQNGPKTSFYERAPTHEPDRLCDCLSLAYGTLGRVRKRRTIFMIGRTRVHLDQVEHLGDYMELEVVLGDSDSVEQGEAEAQSLMAQLQIQRADLIDGAYLDLLSQAKESRV